MSDAIRMLHDYLAKSPSVVYPEDVLEFLSAIKEENDKLIVKLNVEHIVRLNAEAENAKLRETLSILWFCQQFSTDCDDCKLNDGDGKILYPCAQCACDSLCYRMRELGIEMKNDQTQEEDSIA